MVKAANTRLAHGEAVAREERLLADVHRNSIELVRFCLMANEGQSVFERLGRCICSN